MYLCNAAGCIVVSLALQSSISSGFRSLPGFDQNRSDKTSDTGNPVVNTIVSRLTDQLQLSAKAQEKLAELSETSKDLSALSDKVRDSADKQAEASRAAKREEIKQQIEQLKSQLIFASAKDAKALIKKLKSLASDLKQLAGDVASASGAPTIPNNANAGVSAEETGKQLIGALAGAEGVTALVSTTELVGGETLQDGVAISPGSSGQAGFNDQGDGQTGELRSGAQDARSGEGTDQRTEREKQADAYRQIFDAREAVSARGNAQKEELAEIKKLARDLKLLAGQIERKLKEENDDDEKDIKDAKDDLDEVLSTRLETGSNTDSAGLGESVPTVSSSQTDGAGISGGGDHSTATTTGLTNGTVAPVETSSVGSLGGQVASVQIQAYINVQIAVSTV